MSNIIQLNKVRKEKREERSKATTLCASGLHKWKTVSDSRFDVKQGKLVTVEQCVRCKKERTYLK